MRADKSVCGLMRVYKSRSDCVEMSVRSVFIDFDARLTQAVVSICKTIHSN